MVFDPSFGKAIGFPMAGIRFLFNVLMILAVVVGIQAIGVVLMAALLITPGAAARFWTDRLYPLLLLAAFFSVISGILGTYVSFVLPQMPTGPWVVVFLSLIALISFTFSPKSGILFRALARKNYLKKNAILWRKPGVSAAIPTPPIRVLRWVQPCCWKMAPSSPVPTRRIRPIPADCVRSGWPYFMLKVRTLRRPSKP